MASWLSPGWLDIQINGFDGHDPTPPMPMRRRRRRDGPCDVAERRLRRLRDDLHGVRGAHRSLPPGGRGRLRATRWSTRPSSGSTSRVRTSRARTAPAARMRSATSARRTSPSSTAGRKRRAGASGSSRCPPSTTRRSAYIEALAADGVSRRSATRPRRATRSGPRSMREHAGRPTWATGRTRMIRRHPNYIWDQLAEDRLSAGFIFDGQHLPPAVMRAWCARRASNAASSSAMRSTSRASRRASTSCPTAPRWSSTTSGRLSLRGTPYLAGAVAALPVCVANAVRHAGVTLRDAVRMVTANPSRLLGLPAAAGHESLRVGAAATVAIVPRGGRWRRRRADAHDRRRSRRPRRGRMIR